MKEYGEISVSSLQVRADRVRADEVRVNGRPEPLSDATVAALLARHDIGEDTRGVAVALNGAMLPRAQWAHTPLNPDDRIEIVQARQGG